MQEFGRNPTIRLTDIALLIQMSINRYIHIIVIYILVLKFSFDLSLQEWHATTLLRLAIPAVSVSVERLFSSSRLLCTDVRSLLKAETITKAMCTKEWLREGVVADFD